MDGGVDGCQFLAGEVLGNGKNILADGADERERGVQHQCRIDGTCRILVGIRDGDGSDSCRKASADTCY